MIWEAFAKWRCSELLSVVDDVLKLHKRWFNPNIEYSLINGRINDFRTIDNSRPKDVLIRLVSPAGVIRVHR